MRKSVTAYWHALLGTRDDPLVTLTPRLRLQPADVAPRKRFADREADKLAAREHVWHNLCLQLRRAEVQHRGQPNHAARQ